MSTDPALLHSEEGVDKGLKSGALGLVSSVVIGTASTAPAFSLAATLGLLAVGVGFHAPLVAILAFVPMLLISFGYSELNKADPDCGTTFTWATRAFGPRTGWAGGWGIIASDVLVMASLAEVSGQYLFLLFNAKGIGSDPSSFWVLLVGVLFIMVLTYVCYRGIEISAKVQFVLLAIELVMMAVYALVAIVRVAVGHAPPGHMVPSLSWFNPTTLSPTAFVDGLVLMLFIYWGWDTSLSVNEETNDKGRLPGLAGIIATVLLLATYGLVTIAAQAFAGVGTTGIGLANPAHLTDVLSVQGSAVFGSSWFGSIFSHLLLLMVFSSAVASTQTTILPTARTVLSMSVYKAVPDAFGRMHERYLTPTVATVVMGGISIVMYAAMNYMSGGLIILDAVTAIGVWIAFYYGLTGWTCLWYYRRVLTRSTRDLFMKGILPGLGGVIMFAAGAWSLKEDWFFSSGQSYTAWRFPFGPHWEIGGVFLIFLLSAVVGLICAVLWRFASPAFFRGETLNRSTPTLVPEGAALPFAPTGAGAQGTQPGDEFGNRPV
ncbi:MAG: APC family permease [Acidimicrobiales bacterium]|jgi:amino acid transporter